jgi:hypothetical protein
MLTEDLPLIVTNAVEISGWDQDDALFVEKSELLSDEFATKYVALAHRIPDGALVFLRTLQSFQMHRPNPVAFEVEFLGTDSEGLQQFRLNDTQTRYSRVNCLVN